MRYSIRMMEDYDQRIKIAGASLVCYSLRSLQEHFPDGQYTIVGEVGEKRPKNAFAALQLRKGELPVSPVGMSSGLAYRHAGYVQVGSREFIALLKSRTPFFAAMAGMLMMIAVVAAALVMVLGRAGNDPLVIQPNHPLPEPDAYVEILADEPEPSKADTSKGGGKITMNYTLTANIDLSEGTVGIYYQNPSTSSHDVCLDLYIVSGEQEVCIASSGRVPAGTGLYRMDMTEGAAILSEGLYTGRYKLTVYDPLTGEAAQVAPTVEDVTVKVVE